MPSSLAQSSWTADDESPRRPARMLTCSRMYFAGFRALAAILSSRSVSSLLFAMLQCPLYLPRSMCFTIRLTWFMSQPAIRRISACLTPARASDVISKSRSRTSTLFSDFLLPLLIFILLSREAHDVPSLLLGPAYREQRHSHRVRSRVNEVGDFLRREAGFVQHRDLVHLGEFLRRKALHRDYSEEPDGHLIE